MSQLYAQRTRNVAIATSAASAVFLGFALFWIARLGDDLDDPRRVEFVRFRPSGEKLTLSDLATDERVVVTHVVKGDRNDFAWTYVIDGETPRLLARMTRNVVHEAGYGLRPADIAATDAYEITAKDLAGLETAIRFLRVMPATPDNPYYDTYAVEYFRGAKLIGEERFIDDTLRNRGDLGYERLPVAATRTFSIEEWEALVTFAEIAETRNTLSSAN